MDFKERINEHNMNKKNMHGYTDQSSIDLQSKAHSIAQLVAMEDPSMLPDLFQNNIESNQANNESVRELRENRYRQYSRKLKTL